MQGTVADDKMLTTIHQAKSLPYGVSTRLIEYLSVNLDMLLYPSNVVGEHHKDRIFHMLLHIGDSTLEILQVTNIECLSVGAGHKVASSHGKTHRIGVADDIIQRLVFLAARMNGRKLSLQDRLYRLEVVVLLKTPVCEDLLVP